MNVTAISFSLEYFFVSVAVLYLVSFAYIVIRGVMVFRK